ncbi:MAG TPA: CYTH domain-containing protein [Gemmatimonadales bacterium]|nr:CYTH domain-containing protein [Gemmatimonadales bacterium]
MSGSRLTPSDELEVKARVPRPAALRRALVAAGARLQFRGRMSDRRFDRKRRLTRRDEVLRLRVYRPADGAPARGELAWKGPARARGAYRHRLELEAHVTDPDAMLEILRRLRFRESLRIDRRVEIWRLGKAVVRIERYPDMDTLVEVEGAPGAIERAIAASGLPREWFRPEALPHFVRAYEARTGRRARLTERGAGWGGG